MPNRIGYARASIADQSLGSQLEALQQAGCTKIFTEEMSPSRLDRPAWEHVLEYVQPGDSIVVTELSRMSRSLLNLVEAVKMLQERGIDLVSLREDIDTATAAGRCFLSTMGAIHQVERELRAERAALGRACAKARGKSGGRPRTDLSRLEAAKILYENSEKTAAQVCRTTGVGRRTFFAYLAQKRKENGPGPQ
ncbi:MAG: recombinase family protein [Syntrophobacteraceae bacterium]